MSTRPQLKLLAVLPTLLASAALALVPCGRALAQGGGEPGGQPQAAKPMKLSELRRAACMLRREGKLSAAALAFEQILRRLKRTSRLRRPIALETAQLYMVMNKPYMAVAVYRREKDVIREIATLLAIGTEKRAKEALTIARLEGYKVGEANALHALGQTEEAIKVLDRAGRSGLERKGELLLAAKRYKEAAEAFATCEDFYGEAVAMELVPNPDKAKRLYEDAASRIRLNLKTEAIPRFKQARELFKSAKGGAAAESARLFMAQCYGEVAGLFRKLAKCYAGAGEKQKAIKSAQKAEQYLKRQRSTLEDNGLDKYGRKAAEQMGVNKAISEVSEELTSYQSLP
ncbi:MAG TPA: hypothetical protein DEA08_19740 [Planctomycetes bacterium]|nr:hypothetical protein [Planctomycetota bacterium]